MKKRMAIVVGLLLCLFMIIGCAGTEQDNELDVETGSSENSFTTDSNSGEDDEIVLGFISLNLNHPFFVDMMEASAEADEDFGVKSIWKSCESNIDTEIALIDGYIEQGVDCILLSPVDTEAIIPAVKRALDAGIPVVTMSNVIDEPRTVATTFELHETGVNQACLMGTMMEGEGKAAYIVGIPGNDTSDTMQRGFEEGMKEYFPEIEYQILISNYDAPTALQEVEKCLAATPDLKAIGSCSDDALIAASEAFNDRKLFVLGMDGVEAAIEHVRADEWNSTVIVGARRLGYWNTKVGAELARGAEFPHITKMPMGWLLSDSTMEVVEKNDLLEGEIVFGSSEVDGLLKGYRQEFGPDTTVEQFLK